MSLLGLVITWLILLAIGAMLLRRLPWLAGAVVAVGLGWLAWRIWSLPQAETALLLGRQVDLASSVKMLSFTVYLGDAALAPTLLLLAWGSLFAFAGMWVDVDRVLTPAIPLILLALILSLSSTPLLWAPFWLVVAVVTMAFPAQGARPRLARAALRTLLAPVLALPFFLFAAWVLAQPTMAVDDPSLWNSAHKALVLGIAILFTPVPLHGWIVAQGDQAPPLAAAFNVGVWQITVYALLRQILLAYPAVADFADPARWLPILALGQMVWAGIFALGSQRLRQLYGYLLLWNTGANYLLWSLSGEFGTAAMSTLLAILPLSLLLPAVGLSVLDSRFGEGAAYSTLNGALERLPLASLAFLGGGFFVAGWPPGALFAPRLATFRLAHAGGRTTLLLALFSATLLTLALIRALRNLARPLSDPRLPREPRRLAWLLLPLLLVNLLLALNPSLTDVVTTRLVAWMTAL
ncbi:MAG: hypothetical protein D6775_13960 [Caldilineae bacterium]|nr:MAG: hypothetical protein D6775_13960 [Caldilineae bacterium]